MGRLADIADVKEAAGVKRNDDDAFITRLLAAAEVRVERWTGRRFSPEPALTGTPPADTASPVTKEIRIMSGQRVRVPDLRSVVSVSFGGLALASDVGYVLEGSEGFNYVADDGTFHDFPATHIKLYPMVSVASSFDLVAGVATAPKVVIVGRWGFNPTPDDIKDAVITMTARAYKRKDANYADQVQAGVESIALTYFKRLPEEVTDTLAYYRPPRLAVV